VKREAEEVVAMTQLILKRAPIGLNLDDFNVLERGVIVGRIFLSPVAPLDRPWMWAERAQRRHRARRLRMGADTGASDRRRQSIDPRGS
jgi:hypothetical protein